MAAFTFFHCFSEDLAKKKHNLGSDTLKWILTNTAPNAATHAVKTDITEISGGNGYTAGGHATAQASCAQTAGALKLVLTDVTITASVGDIGPFRYAVLFNDTAASDELIGYLDRGVATTLSGTNGDALTLNVDESAGTITLTPS